MQKEVNEFLLVPDDDDTNDTRVFMPQNDPYAVPTGIEGQSKRPETKEHWKKLIKTIPRPYVGNVMALWWFLVKNQQKTITLHKNHRMVCQKFWF